MLIKFKDFKLFVNKCKIQIYVLYFWPSSRHLEKGKDSQLGKNIHQRNLL